MSEHVGGLNGEGELSYVLDVREMWMSRLNIKCWNAQGMRVKEQSSWEWH